jgi:hypothetical protein
MTFNLAIRGLTYTRHITSSLGWVGAGIVFTFIRSRRQVGMRTPRTSRTGRLSR